MIRLKGASASYDYTEIDIWEDLSGASYGGFGELYLDKVTLDISAGHSVSADYLDSAGFSVGASLYAVDDPQLSLGYGYGAVVQGDHDLSSDSFSAGAEYQVFRAQNLGASVSLGASFMDEDIYGASAGVRFFFGDDKSLKDRHRQDF